MVRLENYTKHAQDKCRSHEVIDSPSRMTMGDVLSRPTNLPATAAERKIAEHLVRKIINQGGSDSKGVMRVPTSGQVCINYHNLLVIM